MKHIHEVENEKLIGLTFNHYYALCVKASERSYPCDWEAMLKDHVQDTYLDIAVHGGTFNVVDAKTGDINTTSCYTRYFELMTMINHHYRLDTMALINNINLIGKLKTLTYVQHNQHCIIAEVGYLGLLTHD